MYHSREVIFQGEVLGGKGEARGFMIIDWVKEQCQKITGFEPYPGTLNLKVEKDVFALIREKAMSLGQRIIPPAEAKDFCEARLLSLNVGDVNAAVLYPMVNNYYTDIIEVIAPVFLKNIPGVNNGSRLELSLCPPPITLKPKAIIFDLDGTLIDSIHLYYAMLYEGCRQLGAEPPSKELFLQYMGQGLGFWEVWEIISGKKMSMGGQEKVKTRVIDVFENVFEQRYEQEVKLFAGIGNLLFKLWRKDIKLGIVTSSFYKNKMDLFKREGLEPDELFSAVITSNDTERQKPHPEPIQLCLHQLSEKAEQCLYVGDSPCDIAAGRSAGLFTVGVLTGTGSVQSLSKEGADAIIDHTIKLPNIIK